MIAPSSTARPPSAISAFLNLSMIFDFRVISTSIHITEAHFGAINAEAPRGLRVSLVAQPRRFIFHYRPTYSSVRVGLYTKGYTGATMLLPPPTRTSTVWSPGSTSAKKL